MLYVDCLTCTQRGEVVLVVGVGGCTQSCCFPFCYAVSGQRDFLEWCFHYDVSWQPTNPPKWFNCWNNFKDLRVITFYVALLWLIIVLWPLALSYDHLTQTKQKGNTLKNLFMNIAVIMLPPLSPETPSLNASLKNILGAEGGSRPPTLTLVSLRWPMCQEGIKGSKSCQGRRPKTSVIDVRE